MTWTKLHHLCGGVLNQSITREIILRARSVPEEAILVDDRGYTPLHIAVVANNPPEEVIIALLEANPKAVTEKDLHGDTPLHLALRPNASFMIVREILAACPMVASLKNKEGLMPIHAACRYCPQNEEIIDILVAANPDALRSRTKMGNLIKRKKKISPLLSPHADMPPEHLHPIIDGTISSSFRNSQVKATAELMFEERSHQLREGSYPLHMAIASGAPRSVLELLIRGAPEVISLVDKFGRTCLHLAVENGATSMTSAVMANEVDKSVMVTLDIIELLHSLDKNQVKTPDKRQSLPLHVAYQYECSVDVAMFLMQAYPGAINSKNKEGKRPIDVAVAFGKSSKEAIRLLE